MKIILYGTGAICNRFLQLKKYMDCDVVGFCETKKTKNQFQGLPVYNIGDQLPCFDKMVIANDSVEEVKYTIYRSKIELNKVIPLTLVWMPVEIMDGSLKIKLEGVSQHVRGKSIGVRPNTGIITNSKEVYQLLKKKAPGDFWANLSDYHVLGNRTMIGEGQKKVLDDFFVKYLKSSDIVIDIACASGEWSRYLAPYCKRILGYDISESMISCAKIKAQEYGFSNVEFYNANIFDLNNDIFANHAIMLGLLTCIEDAEQAEGIVRKVNKMLPVGGRLAVRDTLTVYEGVSIFYIANWLNDDYSAIYRDQNQYEKFFTDNGFELVEERYINPYSEPLMEYGSHAYLFKKVKDI